MVGPEQSGVGTLTQVQGPSLAQLRLQLLPVSQRVGELLQMVKYFLPFWIKIFSLTLSRTPSEESWSVSTDDGEVSEGIVSEIITAF